MGARGEAQGLADGGGGAAADHAGGTAAGTDGGGAGAGGAGGCCTPPNGNAGRAAGVYFDKVTVDPSSSPCSICGAPQPPRGGFDASFIIRERITRASRAVGHSASRSVGRDHLRRAL